MDVVTPSGSTLTIDPSKDTKFRIPLSANVTSVVITPNSSGVGRLVELHFEQDSTGSRTVGGWPATVKWAGGTAPTLTTTGNKVDVITLRQVANPGDSGGVKYREIGRAMNSAL